MLTLIYVEYTDATTVTVAIPVTAQSKASYIRWRQLSNSGSNFDEWALDHVRIYGSAYNRNYLVEFKLCMGCGIPYTQQQSASYDVQLEYSVNFGQTWALVEAGCQPGSSSCTQALV